MTTRLVIVGAGGFGREVFGIIQALEAGGSSWDLEGFVDDSPRPSDAMRIDDLGSRIIGSIADLASRREPYGAVIAIGSPVDRMKIAKALSRSPVSFPNLIHPQATLGPRVKLSNGVVIAPGARLSTNVSVGCHVHIDQNVTVGHDSVLGDLCRLNPQACVSGSVEIGSGATIGASAVVLQGLRIGAMATIGAGACVVRNVGSDIVVKGVPAR